LPGAFRDIIRIIALLHIKLPEINIVFKVFLSISNKFLLTEFDKIGRTDTGFSVPEECGVLAKPPHLRPARLPGDCMLRRGEVRRR
jgi:hypothetical protein